MSRLLFPALFVAFAAVSARSLSAQDIPGVRVTMAAARPFVLAGQDLSLVLSIDVQQDAELPAALINGLDLECTPEGGTAVQVREAGKGGAVAVAAGTRIERKLKVASDRIVPTGNADTAHITIQWPGFAGANCVVRAAPDLSKVDVDALDLAKTRVVLVTNFGDMTLAFYPDKAPGTVRNFVKLAKEGFYDGTKFHRVIRNFMIQGGDPFTRDDAKEKQWGMGDPGYKIKGEVNDTRHRRGVISMANSGSPDTAGSQFFICHRDAERLNQGYTAFGALEQGLDVLDAIANVQCHTPQGSGDPMPSRPNDPIILQQAVVLGVKKK